MKTIKDWYRVIENLFDDHDLPAVVVGHEVFDDRIELKVVCDPQQVHLLGNDLSDALRHNVDVVRYKSCVVLIVR